MKKGEKVKDYVKRGRKCMCGGKKILKKIKEKWRKNIIKEDPIRRTEKERGERKTSTVKIRIKNIKKRNVHHVSFKAI